MTQEYFDIVDENNKPTGEKALRAVAHREGLWHRVVHLYLFRHTDNAIELLVHQRSLLKDLNPGKWDTRFGGHVQSGETIEQAIAKEAWEEIGLKIDTENLIIGNVEKYDGEKNKEFCYVFYYHFAHDIRELSFNDGEVQSVKWMGLEEIENSMKLHSSMWTGSINGLRAIQRDLMKKMEK